MRLCVPLLEYTHVWYGHFLTLAAALNLDLTQTPARLRRTIRRAVTTLIDKEFLDPKSGFTRKDIVTLVRRPVSKLIKKQIVK